MNSALKILFVLIVVCFLTIEGASSYFSDPEQEANNRLSVAASFDGEMSPSPLSTATPSPSSSATALPTTTPTASPTPTLEPSSIPTVSPTPE